MGFTLTSSKLFCISIACFHVSVFTNLFVTDVFFCGVFCLLFMEQEMMNFFVFKFNTSPLPYASFLLIHDVNGRRMEQESVSQLCLERPSHPDSISG